MYIIPQKIIINIQQINNNSSCVAVLIPAFSFSKSLQYSSNGFWIFYILYLKIYTTLLSRRNVKKERRKKKEQHQRKTEERKKKKKIRVTPKKKEEKTN